MSPDRLTFRQWCRRYSKVRNFQLQLLSDELGIECIEGMAHTTCFREDALKLFRILYWLEDMPCTHPLVWNNAWSAHVLPSRPRLVALQFLGDRWICRLKFFFQFS